MAIYVTKQSAPVTFARLGQADTALPLTPLEQDRIAAIRELRSSIGSQWSDDLHDRLMSLQISADRVTGFSGQFFTGTRIEVGPTDFSDLGHSDRINSAWVPRGFRVAFCSVLKGDSATWCSVPFVGPRFLLSDHIHRELAVHNAKGEVWARNQSIGVSDQRTPEVRAAQREGTELAEISRQRELTEVAAAKMREQETAIQAANTAKILEQSAVERAQREAAANSAAALEEQRGSAQLLIQGQALQAQVQQAQVRGTLQRMAMPAAAAVLILVGVLVVRRMR